MMKQSKEELFKQMDNDPEIRKKEAEFDRLADQFEKKTGRSWITLLYRMLVDDIMDDPEVTNKIRALRSLYHGLTEDGLISGMDSEDILLLRLMKNYIEELESTGVKPPRALSLRQIALLYIYSGRIIGSEKDANLVAKGFGHSSGKRLKTHYNKLGRTTDRRFADSPQKAKNLIQDIEATFEYLSGKQVDMAKEDIAHLERFL